MINPVASLVGSTNQLQHAAAALVAVSDGLTSLNKMVFGQPGASLTLIFTALTLICNAPSRHVIVDAAEAE